MAKSKYYKRPDGLFESIRTINGKRVAFRGKSCREVDRKILDYREEVEKGWTFQKASDQWYEAKEKEVRHATYRSYGNTLRRLQERFGAETVFTSPYTTEINQYKQVVEAADEVGAELCVPDFGAEYRLGEAVFTFIGPVEEYSDTNDNSLVLRLTYGDKSFLFTGDMEREAENDLLDSGVKLSSDVLKVGHHGSSTSTSYRFLYEVSPEIAVISCGEDNSYGHPHEEVLSRLSDADVTVYRTDLDGSVVLFCDGMKVTKK